MEEPFNVTSAAVHLQLSSKCLTGQLFISSSQKLAISIRTIICGSKMTVTTSVNNEFQVTNMLEGARAFKLSLPPPQLCRPGAVPVEADGWVKPSLPRQIKMSPMAKLSALPPICSSATELRWMPVLLEA